MVSIATINSVPSIASGISVSTIQANDQALKVAVDAIEAGVNGWVGKTIEWDATSASLPTYAYRGIKRGLSFPIWQTGVTEENITMETCVPFEWDGTTAPLFVAMVTPSALETDGDKFQFQLSWNASSLGEVIPDTNVEALTDEITLTAPGNAAFYAHIMVFELTPATLSAGQNLQFELRRIAASASEVAAEPIVWHWDTRWKCDKLATLTSGY